MDDNIISDLLNVAKGMENIKNFVSGQFDYYWNRIRKLPDGTVKKKVVKEITTTICIAYPMLMENKGYNFDLSKFDMGIAIRYVYHYLAFYTGHLSDEDRVKKYNDKAFKDGLVNDICNDMFFNEDLEMLLNVEISEFSPVVVGYKTLCKLLLKYVALDIPKNNLDFKGTYLNMLFQQAFGMVESCLMLAANGLASDALALWRTLHELECVVILLTRYDEKLIGKYVDHQKYYDLEVADEYNTNEKVEKLKEELALAREPYTKRGSHKAFINYGWLLLIKEFRESNRPLNFKDGLQYLAGQSHRYKAYMTASKASHPTAVTLIRKQSSFFIVLISQLYDTMYNLINYAMTFVKRYNPSFSGAEEEILKIHLGRLDTRHRFFMENLSSNSKKN